MARRSMANDERTFSLIIAKVQLHNSRKLAGWLCGKLRVGVVIKRSRMKEKAFSLFISHPTLHRTHFILSVQRYRYSGVYAITRLVDYSNCFLPYLGGQLGVCPCGFGVSPNSTI